jgi:hypothetical protein
MARHSTWNWWSGAISVVGALDDDDGRTPWGLQLLSEKRWHVRVPGPAACRRGCVMVKAIDRMMDQIREEKVAKQK